MSVRYDRDTSPEPDAGGRPLVISEAHHTMRTLFDSLQPRKSVFDRSKTDTVAKLTEIDTIDAEEFFAENYITEAMRTLLPEAFKRLEQRGDAAGVFHLAQAMGGGKTHSLI